MNPSLIYALFPDDTGAAPPPDLLSLIPIRKTRAGLQFTSAAPTLGLNSHNLKDVWVCNSDGYVGQVILFLFMQFLLFLDILTHLSFRCAY